MSTIQVEAQLSYKELLKAVEQLSSPEAVTITNTPKENILLQSWAKTGSGQGFDTWSQ